MNGPFTRVCTRKADYKEKLRIAFSLFFLGSAQIEHTFWNQATFPISVVYRQTFYLLLLFLQKERSDTFFSLESIIVYLGIIISVIMITVFLLAFIIMAKFDEEEKSGETRVVCFVFSCSCFVFVFVFFLSKGSNRFF